MRRIDDRLTVSVSTERKAYRIGESICLTAVYTEDSLLAIQLLAILPPRCIP